MLDNKSIRAEARNRLSGNWGQPIGVFAIYLLITVVLQNIPFIGTIALLLIAGHLTLGLAIYFLKFFKYEEANLNLLFEGFKNYGGVLVTYLLYSIYILLWTLLFHYSRNYCPNEIFSSVVYHGRGQRNIGQ